MPRKIPDLTASIPQPQEPRLLLGDLRNAIDTAQPQRLRLVLWSLCNSSVEAATIGRTLLLVSEDEDDEEEEDEEGFESEEKYSDNSATAPVLKASPVPKTPKRLRPRFATCEHCSEEFDVIENEDDACTWHDGKA
ncbi:hypothetical protein N7G274_003659 [Stereocaulon virgatum]|uniref:C2H2-type domain-containing protein n=1 Tax=Stereocaulon virgatum TaxID=373712 RepID=A0ABR4AE60_9LECA